MAYETDGRARPFDLAFGNNSPPLWKCVGKGGTHSNKLKKMKRQKFVRGRERALEILYDQIAADRYIP